MIEAIYHTHTELRLYVPHIQQKEKEKNFSAWVGFLKNKLTLHPGSLAFGRAQGWT